MEGEIHKVCKSFSLENKKQEKNLIESIKNNCADKIISSLYEFQNF